jgi:hypothetical protein
MQQALTWLAVLATICIPGAYELCAPRAALMAVRFYDHVGFFGGHPGGIS